MPSRALTSNLPFDEAVTVHLEDMYVGHRLAFEFFGGVPCSILYDNVADAVQVMGRNACGGFGLSTGKGS